jgi:hypothetical protein
MFFFVKFTIYILVRLLLPSFIIISYQLIIIIICLVYFTSTFNFTHFLSNFQKKVEREKERN